MLTRHRCRRGVLWAVALALAPALRPVPAAAQGGLTPAQLEQLRRNPELLREQIRLSGLTPEQIRTRLRAAGYPADLLDAYLPGAAGAVREPGAAELGALAALGLPFEVAAHLLPVDTGLITRGIRDSTRVFGVDAFRRTTTQFLPLLAGPVPPDYRLGPGDVLVLAITGDVEVTHTLTVTREGFVLIPQVGQLAVANLTMEQLRDVLYQRLGRVYSGVRRAANATTRFDVSVANVRSNQVYVVGEVTQPSAYQISALGTVLTALYAAGGVTERASLRRIEVRRADTVAAALDLYDYLLRGSTRQDVRLETGDVVFVGLQGPRVDVSGAVVREGIYELAAGDGLPQVIAAAGGLRPDAELRRITVHRYLSLRERGPGPAPRAAIDVELSPQVVAEGAPADSGGRGGLGPSVQIPALALQDGDSVVVHQVPPLLSTYFVGIAGMVRRPGPYPWRPGMTLRDLMKLAGGVRVGADLREAEVARMPEDRSGGQLATAIRVPLDSSYLLERDTLARFAGPPGVSFPAAGTAPEVTLQPYDEVLILKVPEFELQRSVTITGEVYFPGTWALTRKDERVSDLVRRSGGLLPTAFPEGARFIRALNSAGRVNIDLSRALARPQSRDDVVLQPGDSLDIPEYIPTVRVQGAVIAPTSVLFEEGRGLDYYIGNAGGYARNADKGKVSVRYANGSARVKSKFLFFSSTPTPRPGSVVNVPEKPEGEPFNVTAFLAAAAQILASTVAIIVVATR